MGLTVVLVIVLSLIIPVGAAITFRRGKKLDLAVQHVLITGGSQGMGKALAKELAARGANLTIIARTKTTLEAAAEEIRSFHVNAQQTTNIISLDCSDADAVSRVIGGLQCPDILFCCAGTAHPGLFVDLKLEELTHQMQGNYFSTLFVTHTVLKKMISQPRHSASEKRHIILTSSVTAFLGLSGYSAYTPTKAAIRALADTLRQECLMYDIDVHCVFPATIYSPGYQEEQKLKPELTKLLEEGDSGQTPEQVAKATLMGLDAGHFMINTEMLGNLLRCNMKGPSPKNGAMDLIYSSVASFVFPFVAHDWDVKVKKYSRSAVTTN